MTIHTARGKKIYPWKFLSLGIRKRYTHVQEQPLEDTGEKQPMETDEEQPPEETDAKQPPEDGSE